MDTASAEAFAAELDRPGPTVIDCHAVEFIDSSGLRALLEARRRADRDGDQLILRQPSEVVRRILKITATDELFTIEG
jgi:anti-anti-sigma factor